MICLDVPTPKGKSLNGISHCREKILQIYLNFIRFYEYQLKLVTHLTQRGGQRLRLRDERQRTFRYEQVEFSLLLCKQVFKSDVAALVKAPDDAHNLYYICALLKDAHELFNQRYQVIAVFDGKSRTTTHQLWGGGI